MPLCETQPLRDLEVEDIVRDRGDLTHWGRDKMAAIFQTKFQMDFLEWKYINFD